MSAKHSGDKRIQVLGAVIVAVIFFVVGSVVVIQRAGRTQPPADAAAVTQLAECLTQKGAKMYGAYWCPHCQQQKKDFGDAFAKVDYVECSPQGTPQGQQAQVCTDAGVKNYPTWIFPDGSRQTGELSFADLAAKSGCAFAPSAAAPAPAANLNIAQPAPVTLPAKP